MESFVREIIIDLLNDPQFSDRHITFSSRVSELKLPMDQHLMKRAILNLIYNALIHNDEHVEIAIIVERTRKIVKEQALVWRLLVILLKRMWRILNFQVK